jgi:chaperone required for assembly of F1-ATPase
VVPGAALAEAVAAEWRAQGDRVDPATMPLTRLVNVAIDHVGAASAAVRTDIVKYAGSDLVCYRADGPAALVAAQEAHWGPLVAWANQRFGIRLRTTTGIAHVAQDASLGAAVAAAIAQYPPLRLAALHLATTLTGSAVVALALAESALAPDAAWEAAHVDEDWQMAQWGTDTIALAARANRRRDFDAAAFVLTARSA